MARWDGNLLSTRGRVLRRHLAYQVCPVFDEACPHGIRSAMAGKYSGLKKSVSDSHFRWTCSQALNCLPSGGGFLEFIGLCGHIYGSKAYQTLWAEPHDTKPLP